ncbi:MAG: hypothetical protein KME35_10190 [Aphanocapsa sp. GSE-SYN-MK-11-07L]|nr:hypothetical protein [Aphanocapsa sp. GSE-SYN-MK-11-07L]
MSDLFFLAQQGNTEAIASLLTEHFQAQAISVAVQRRQECLQVMLEADPVPEQRAIAAVAQIISGLAIPDLKTLKLFARRPSDRTVAWSQLIPLTEALPDKMIDLRHLAGQGNTAAMTRLLNQSLAHKQITAAITYQERDLKIGLTAPTLPDQQTSLTLIARELTHWHLPAQTMLTVSGQVTDACSIDWQRVAPLAQLSLSPVHSVSPSLADAVSLEPWQANEPVKIQFQRLDPSSLRAIAAGLFLSLLLIASGRLSFLFGYLVTVVHELGHTACAWFFGYPAIPAFDFMFGGGVTMHGDRHLIIVWLIYLGFGGLAYFYRRNRLTSRFLLGLIITYTIFAFTAIHNMLFVIMGHGFELLFAGIFLYRGLSGFGCRHSIEQPLYGMVGFFIVFYDLRFSWRLIADPIARAVYEQGKGGIIDNDLVRLVRDYVPVDLSAIAWIFLILSALIPGLIFQLYRHQAVMLATFNRLFLTRVD